MKGVRKWWFLFTHGPGLLMLGFILLFFGLLLWPMGFAYRWFVKKSLAVADALDEIEERKS